MAKTKVLYVEDEPFLGRIVKDTLEVRDFDVGMVADGNEVMPLFEELNPDICILDVMLPHKDGFTLAQSIRQLQPTIPIIFVTAKTQTEDLVKGFEVGGNDYLRKPFSMEELIVRIHNLLQLAQKVNANTKEFIGVGSFEFVPQRYELRKNGKVRKLSHREAMLVQILAENKNTIVNRKGILLRIWGDDSFFNSRNLDVYITKLRDYFKEDPSIEIITIKGIGYHFAVGN